MISYTRHILDNGLTVICHRDTDTPLATVNLLYGVGSRNEEPHRTGFAHLCEHLMFGGTRAVPDYDQMVNSLGGEANAFTNCDITNYYLTVPARHLETALRIEADRMQGVELTQRQLEVQQRVITEEYHQRYLNQPYGDVWMLLRPLSYRQHPYRWCTIGSDIAHVQQASLEEVHGFLDCHYRPSNAILAVAGAVDVEQTLRWAERWFGGIADNGNPCQARHLPPEPEPDGPHQQTVHRTVPADAFYRTYLMCDRNDPLQPAMDLLSDILSNGESSRLHSRLVKGMGLFSDLDAYLSGDFDRGLFVISGKLNSGVSMEEAEQAVEAEVRQLVEQLVDESELEKVVNKYEATFALSHYRVSDRAQSLCHYQWLGNLDGINNEPELYRRTTSDMLHTAAQSLLPQRANTLYYRSK